MAAGPAPSPQDAVWQRHADRWSWQGAPLRPGPEDCAHYAHLAFPALGSRASAAVLGVTPELVRLPWPAGIGVHAFDHSAAMVRTLWAPDPDVRAQVCVAAWEALPCADASVDAAVGDNSLGSLPGLSAQLPVLRSLARVLRAGGRLVLRYATRPGVPEPPQAVVDAALEGRIRSFHALKCRVAVLLGSAPEFSVAVADIHATFQRLFPDRERLAAAGGWPPELVDTIDAYAGAPTRYTFPPLAAVLDAARPWFEVITVRHGGYELAERFPMVAFRRRAGAATG